MYTGFELSDESREKLLKLFPPKFSDVLGHHITLKFGVKKEEPLPKQPKEVNVVGVIEDDNDSIQGLLVEVDGNIERPDGKMFHITWSIDRDKGAKPFHTNDWTDSATMIQEKIPITVTSKLFNRPTSEYVKKGD